MAWRKIFCRNNFLQFARIESVWNVNLKHRKSSIWWIKSVQKMFFIQFVFHQWFSFLILRTSLKRSDVKKDQCKKGRCLIRVDVKRLDKVPWPFQCQPHKMAKHTQATSDELFFLSILWDWRLKMLKVFVDTEIARELLMKSQTLVPKFLMTLR